MPELHKNMTADEVHYFLIPAYFAFTAQPCDIVSNKPLKDRLKKISPSPTRGDISAWAPNNWEEFSRGIIQKWIH